MKLQFTGYRDSIMREEIKSFHEEAFNLFLSKNPRYELLNEVVLEINLNYRMRSVAGKANSSKKLIQINYRLHKENRSELIKTYIHELAHIIVGLIHTKRVASHGREWQRCMRALGQSPERTHSMDTSKLKQKRKKFTVYCNCSEHEVGAKRYKKIATAELLKERSPYVCKKCKEGIKSKKESTEDLTQ